MGPKGTIKAARKYLAGLKLASFAKKTEKKFQAVLNRATLRFVNHLPRRARHWGAARKFLNIFLRGVLYNRYLCEHYNLYRIERWLELPLDSHVAKCLHREKGSGILPRWKTVIGLDKDTNQRYQEFATEVAKRKKYNTYRIHLDVYYWRHEFVAPNSSYNRTRRTRLHR